jgi:hypothetical protein
MYRLHLQGIRKNPRMRNQREQVCSYLLMLVPPAWIFSPTLKMEAIHSSETSVYTISTWRHIPEDGILHVHYMSYILGLILWGGQQPLKNPSASQVRRTQDTYFISHCACGIIKRPKHHNKTLRLQQMPEMVPILMQAFLAHTHNVHINTLRFLFGERQTSNLKPETLHTSHMHKVSMGLSRAMFMPSTNFVRFLISDHSTSD